jgi:hypothetical protein
MFTGGLLKRPRRQHTCYATAFALAALAQSGFADHAPAYVIPGRPDVPVMINGYDAAWGVVEGDWGLYRPGAIAPVVIPSGPTIYPPRARSYFPSLGRQPLLGRREIDTPPRRLAPAPSFRRSWGAASDPGPATDYAPSLPIIVAPTVRPPHNP